MKNLKMSTKLLTGYAIVIAFTIIVGATGIIGLVSINKSYTQSYISTALPVPIMASAIEELDNIGINVRNAIIYIDDSSLLQEAINNITDIVVQFESHIEEYEFTITNPNSQEEYYRAVDLYQTIYKPTIYQLIDLTQNGNASEAIEVTKSVTDVRLTILKYLRSSLQYDYLEGEAKSKSNTKLSYILVVFLVTVIILSVSTSIIVALYLSKIITKPIIFTKKVLSRIGLHGDLEFSEDEYKKTELYASYKDEIGQSIGMMLTTVHRLVDLGNSLEKVASGNLTSNLPLLSDKDIMGISLQKMTHNLSDMFHELELQAVALREAKDIAVQNSYYKSEFLSRMSHEIRTPMNAIIGMTNLAKKADTIERKDYCLTKIDSASVHLLGVINDVLDMSKIEAGKLELSMTEFNLEKMLIKIINVLSFRIDEKEQSLHIKVDQNVPMSIVSDEQRLSQVITNLLGNANKFTPENGSITLSIRRLDNDDNFCTLEFEVSDTGLGISKEQQEKLFQPFEQADGTISRKFGGTGLGLVISKSIVEMMGGNIRIESALEQGASFIFTIHTEIGKTLPTESPVFNINWDNLRVLAVDDDDYVREFFSHMIDSYDINCEIASGGNEALEIIEQQKPYNIVFVDWKMPEMDGISLTKKIKEKQGANTIVIMISAMEWSSIETEARQAGVDGFISKPLFGSTIIDCINEFVTPKQQIGADRDLENDTGCFEGKRILLAEDIEINREIVIAMFENTGLQIDCAENGEIAYNMFKDDPTYDLIFMDIHMPMVNGYEATKMIRSLDLPQAKTVPITAMTASVFKEDIERCLQSGMNSHIGKPLDIEAVISNLKKYLA